MSATARDFGTQAERLDDLSARLTRFVEGECGAGCRAANLQPMEEGHAGLTFGFDIVNAAAAVVGSYVLKLAPVGVARRGNTDVYRQAPLLRGLKQAGAAVPAVPWASPSEDILGTPFIVMERMPGRIFFVWGPHASFPRDDATIARLVARGGATCLRICIGSIGIGCFQTGSCRARCAMNSISGRRCFAMPLSPQSHRPAQSCIRLLTAHVPNDSAVGVVHGDYQPGNILYAEGKAGAVIDWELASIGAQGLDVGWLMMLTDPLAWPAPCRPTAPVSRARCFPCLSGCRRPRR